MSSYCLQINILRQLFDRVVGRYDFIKPLLFIKDLELIKKITVKDFDNFVDHQDFFNRKDDFFGRNLFSLQGLNFNIDFFHLIPFIFSEWPAME